MTLPIPTALTMYAVGPLETIELTTDTPSHWYLCIQSEEPSRSARTKRRRGQTYQCGWLYHWTRLTCYPQTEPGDTLTHTYTIPLTAPGAYPWGVFTMAVPLARSHPQTVPLHLIPNAFPPPADHILDTFHRPDVGNTLGSTESPVYPWDTYSLRALDQRWEIHNLHADCDSNYPGPLVPNDPTNVAIVAHDLVSTDHEVLLTHATPLIPLPFAFGPAIRIQDESNYLYASRDFVFFPLFPFRLHDVTAGIDTVLATGPAADFPPGTTIQLKAVGTTVTVTTITAGVPTLQLTHSTALHLAALRAGIAKSPTSSASEWSAFELNSPPL